MEQNLMTAKQLSEETQIPEKTLAQWRYQGRGPQYLKLEGHVRYRRNDVDDWFAGSDRSLSPQRPPRQGSR